MLGTISELGVPYILTHVRGSREMILKHPNLLEYGVKVTKRVEAELSDRVERAQAAGIARWNLIVDPGLGMGKKPEDCVSCGAPVCCLPTNNPSSYCATWQQYEIVCHMQESCPPDIPIVCSVSRKDFVTKALKERQRGKRKDNFGFVLIYPL